MSTEWVVTTATERVTLNDQRQGETTFTVTNPDTSPDRAVFEVVVGEGTNAGWFSVEEPQRLIRGSASVSFLMKATVPADVPPGEYAVQGRVYSAESAPEESSALSNRVLLDVPPAPKPTRRPIPWWIPTVAALVVGALIAGGVALLRRDDPPPPSTTVAVPNLANLTPEQIKATLTRVGLTPKVLYLHLPSKVGEVEQAPPAGAQVDRESTVEARVAVNLTPTRLKGPSYVQAPYNKLPTLEWTQLEPYVTTWRIWLYQYTCDGAGAPCTDLLTIDETVTTTSFNPVVRFSFQETGRQGPFHTGKMHWQVFPVDSVGTSGPLMMQYSLQAMP
jgi:hypothetical protein